MGKVVVAAFLRSSTEANVYNKGKGRIEAGVAGRLFEQAFAQQLGLSDSGG